MVLAYNEAAPLFDKDFSLELHESAMNKTLWGTNETTSIYIQDPSSEVDAAWDYISAEAGQVITISSREAKRLGRDPGVITKAPRDWELGDDAYLAQVDAFHEIHCLNMLRKEIVRARPLRNKNPLAHSATVLGLLLSSEIW